MEHPPLRFSLRYCLEGARSALLAEGVVAAAVPDDKQAATVEHLADGAGN